MAEALGQGKEREHAGAGRLPVRCMFVCASTACKCAQALSTECTCRCAHAHVQACMHAFACKRCARACMRLHTCGTVSNLYVQHASNLYVQHASLLLLTASMLCMQVQDTSASMLHMQVQVSGRICMTGSGKAKHDICRRSRKGNA